MLRSLRWIFIGFAIVVAVGLITHFTHHDKPVAALLLPISNSIWQWTAVSLGMPAPFDVVASTELLSLLFLLLCGLAAWIITARRQRRRRPSNREGRVPRRLIVTVHGIRTFGGWQERLEDLAKAKLGAENIRVINYKYGYFSIIAFIIPFFRWLVVRKFRHELMDLCAEEEWSRLDLIGHSFGTHVIAWSVAGLPSKSEIKVHTIILAGSVLRADFPWRDLMDERVKRVKRVANDCGSKDNVLLLNQFFVLFTGMAGRTGFSGATSDAFRNRYSVFGHGGYFQDETGNQTDNYMNERWLPLFEGDGPIPEFDERKISLLSGVVTVLANNTEPVKLLVYVSPVAFALWWVFGLYVVADIERDRALRFQSGSLVSLTQHEMDKGDHVTAMLLALEALPDTTSDDKVARARPYLPSAGVRLALARHHAHPELAILFGHTDQVLSAAFSPDDKLILTASRDGTARIWDRVSGAALGVLESHGGQVASAAFSPDGRLIVTASNYYGPTSRSWVAQIWDAQTLHAIGAPRQDHEEGEGPLTSAIFSPDSKRLITTAWDAKARLWDVETGKLICVFSDHAVGVQNAAFSRDGRRAVTAGWDKTARIWDAENCESIKEFRGHDLEVVSAVFSPDGNQILTGSLDHTARLWDVETGKTEKIFSGHDGTVTSVMFSADGRRILTGSGDGTARLWDVKKGNPIGEPFAGHDDVIASAALSSDAQRIVTASWDGTARLWNAERKPVGEFIKGYGVMRTAVVSPDGRRILTASDDKTAREWDALTGDPIGKPFEGHEDWVWSAAYSPDGRTVVTASKDGTVRLWNEETHDLIRVFGKVNTSPVRYASFSPDGRYLITTSERHTSPSEDRLARVWDAGSREVVHELIGDSESVVRSTFSRDGRRIVTASADKTARLWDAETGKQIGTLNHPHWVSSAVFSSDGQRILTAAADKIVRLWDVSGEDPKVIRELRGHEDQVITAVFSPDERFILSASLDKTARLWDTESGEPIDEFRGHDGGLWGAAFSRDGRYVITASDDGTVRRWVVFPRGQTLVNEVKALVPRCLSPGQRKKYFAMQDLPPPPSWCIEAEKWPYGTAAWRNWLSAKRAAMNVEVPND